MLAFIPLNVLTFASVYTPNDVSILHLYTFTSAGIYMLDIATYLDCAFLFWTMKAENLKSLPIIILCTYMYAQQDML